MSKPTEPPQPNAADYDEHASYLICRGDFEQARVALLARDALRADGDTSTVPSPRPPITSREYLEAAEEWEAEGKHEHAFRARQRAAELSAQENDTQREGGL